MFKPTKQGHQQAVQVLVWGQAEEAEQSRRQGLTGRRTRLAGEKANSPGSSANAAARARGFAAGLPAAAGVAGALAAFAAGVTFSVFSALLSPTFSV